MSRQNWLRIVVAALGLTAVLTSCASSSSPWIELKGRRYEIEVADDFDSRARGLMFRDHLAADRGMLFVYPHEQPSAFWMKNTKIPLDILYFDRNRRLVHAQRRVPPCSLGDACPSYPSPRPAMYVLELNAGQAEVLKLNTGDAMSFSASVPTIGKP